MNNNAPDTETPAPQNEGEEERCSQSGELSCRVLERGSDWETTKPWWDRLLDESDYSTPWQSWDYLSAWWHNLGKGKQLRIFVVERNGVPILAMPLQISIRFEMIGVPTRMIEPVGMIMDVNRPRLALGRSDAAAYERALQELWCRRHEWDLLRIDEKAHGDREVLFLEDFSRKNGLWYRNIFSHLCPWLDLQQTWADYLANRGKRLRKNLKAGRRKLESMGTVRLQRYESPDEVESAYEFVLALHQKSWKHRKRVEHSQSPAYQAFYRRWLIKMASRGCARILILFCNHQPVAAAIAFMHGSTYHAAQIVHDADFNAVSPGTLIESLELEGLMTEGRYTTYDFLGAFLNNKMRWTDTAIETSLIFVMQPSLRTGVVDGYYFRLKPWVKSSLRRIGLLRPSPHGASTRSSSDED